MGTYSNITIENDQFYSLEKHFEIACNRHPHLKLLESQWRFDQELISKALQNINSIFPHYSRHDASHSKQIIVNIERMLGDKIKYLSATDTWLILEAAYNHDIGMVITQKQIEDMNTPEFKDFVKNMSQESENELCNFAKDWIEQKAILPPNAEAHSIVHQYTQLLAEWYRKKHPQNSARIIRNPLNEIGLDSPRNELLPKRLFKVLSNICKAHGDDFEKVKKLPKAEAGMASEDCHPLYVACLIRMGDLLDVDDNRFCPVMMQMCGTNLPSKSLAHYHKHQSISHFRLDSEQIEITCECPTPEAYEEAFDWFSWLSKEYNNQTQHWNNIVPCKELGRLPTLIEPIVKINKPYFILKEGKKPEFLINQKTIMDLVRGANLYPSKFDSIREVLQNSVDATILRVWLDHKEEINELDPTKPRLFEIYDKYKISVDVIDFDENYWEVSIVDKGIGIDIPTLNYMFEIGSSYKNLEKNNILNEMPNWFKPSGNFGIGFQSLFLVSDNIVLTSRHVNSKNGIEVKFNNRNSRIELVISELSDHLEIGTRLKIMIKKNTFKKDLNYDFYSRIFQLNNNLLDIDFSDNQIELMSIENKIRDFFKYSPIKNNNFFRDSSEINYYSDGLVVRNVNYREKDHKRMSEQSNDALILYRGQPVRKEINRFESIFSDYIDFSVDIYGYCAKEILNYSRDGFLPEKLNEIRRLLKNILIDYTVNNFSEIPENQKGRAASFLYVNDFSDRKNKLYLKFILERQIEIDGKKFSFKDIVDKLTVGGYCWGGVDKEVLKKSGINKKTYLNYNSKFQNSDDIFLIHKIIMESGFYHKIHTNIENEACDILSYTKEPVFYFTKEIFKDVLLDFYKDYGNKNFLANVWGEFQDLAIKHIPYFYPIYCYSDKKGNLLLPIYFDENEFKFEDLNKMDIWVFENRKDKNVSFERISELNKKLEKIIKEIL